ncbi:MAG: hypothetical protein IJX99_01930 [Clostridia bacterium]|nr:hypothetical protein [Clostridia bacterium]
MNQELYDMSWEELENGAREILKQIRDKEIKVDTLVPILRGGAPLGGILSCNMPGTDISYIHVRRSTSDDTNAFLGTPVLKGITNLDAVKGKNILVVDDMLDKGVTMKFVLEELKKLEPESIHVAVIYNFTKLDDEEKFLIGGKMETKKWIVFPWEKKI